MQAVVTALRAAQTHNLHRAGGRFGVAFVLAFAGSVLSSPGPVRPTTGQAFADALSAVGRDA